MILKINVPLLLSFKCEYIPFKRKKNINLFNAQRLDAKVKLILISIILLMRKLKPTEKNHVQQFKKFRKLELMVSFDYFK